MGFPDPETYTRRVEPDERKVVFEGSATKPVRWLKSPGGESVSVGYGKGDGSVRETVTMVFLGITVKAHLSEDDYLPMTPVMRKKLLTGKRFHHVVPSSLARRGGDAKKAEELEKMKKCEIERDDSPVAAPEKMAKEGKREVEVDVVKEVEKEEVKVGEDPSTGSQSKSLGALGEKGCEEQQQHLYFMKSPTLTNRRYSLMDMRLSETKSHFAMKLKDRLRQSKLELGFDDEFLNWKEFVYKDNPEGGRKSMERHVNFNRNNEIFYDTNSVVDSRPMEVVAHNCQILGLCGMKQTRVDIFPKLVDSREPSVFREAVTGCENGLGGLRRLEKSHRKKGSCNCDECTLAYLTDMGFPDPETYTRRVEPDERKVVFEGSATKPVRWLKSPGGESVLVGYGKGDGSVRETVRVIDRQGDSDKAVEVKIYSGRSNESGKYTGNNSIIQSSSPSSVSRTSVEEDSTNMKIRRLFEENGNAHKYSNSRMPVGARPDSHQGPYNDVSIVNISTDQEYEVSDKCPTQTLSTRGNLSQNKKRAEPIVAINARKRSSPCVLSPSASSSLSSIMSYKRVKQIFQSIIEKNRPRKRTRRNIHKFLEMEELGLGEVRNNRWYPSDSKTKAIWNDIASARGVQAQFRRCHYRGASRPEVK